MAMRSIYDELFSKPTDGAEAIIQPVARIVWGSIAVITVTVIFAFAKSRNA